jgi:arylsulfatase A-like enzyme
MKRRDFIKHSLLGVGGISLFGTSCVKAGINISNETLKVRAGNKLPNMILCMCDDLGWGDVGYHNTASKVKTPCLDDMAKRSMQFSRFYAGAPVCSPTRGSCITGRHPYRYGVTYANVGKMKDEEITLAEALKPLGYRSGHFGKWHLGTLTTEMRDSNRGTVGNTADYSPPQDNGFDVCFSAEAKVPTWDPMYKVGTTDYSNPANYFGTRYWREDGTFVPQDSEALRGANARVIMDQAIPFIQDAVAKDKPFLAVIWFHAPHYPYVAGPDYKALYSDLSEDEKNYYGCITQVDEQMGRLRNELQNLGIAENTMLWFTSDNGPEQAFTTPGSAGPYRGTKRWLYEGGVRVPGLLEWPDKIKKHSVMDMACSTCDYFPTSMEIAGYTMKGQPEPIDGVSLLPLINGTMTQRPTPLGFQTSDGHGDQRALIDNQYKLYSKDNGATYELYDIINDPYETTDIASQHPDVVASMEQTLENWIASCANSSAGNDYS